MTRNDALRGWLLEALAELGGSAHLVRVAEHIWTHHEHDLRAAGDLFYTWQYDLRWEAQKMRDRGMLAKPDGRGDGTWTLAEPPRAPDSPAAPPPATWDLAQD